MKNGWLVLTSLYLIGTFLRLSGWDRLLLPVKKCGAVPYFHQTDGSSCGPILVLALFYELTGLRLKMLILVLGTNTDIEQSWWIDMDYVVVFTFAPLLSTTHDGATAPPEGITE